MDNGIEEMEPGNVEIDGYRLVLTCSACPEQYDVFQGDLMVGYLRLRHGRFRADVPDCGGETIYEAYPSGDGAFDPDERHGYLSAAVAAIRTHYATAGGARAEPRPPTPDEREAIAPVDLLDVFEAALVEGTPTLSVQSARLWIDDAAFDARTLIDAILARRPSTPSAGVEEARVLPADFDHLDSIRRKLVFHHALSAHESAALARFEAVARALAQPEVPK